MAGHISHSLGRINILAIYRIHLEDSDFDYIDPLGWWRNRKQEYPILVRLVRKYQRPSHKHAGGEGLQLDGLDAQQEKIEHVRRECDDAALLERQHGDLVMLIFKFCSFLGSFQLWTFTINY